MAWKPTHQPSANAREGLLRSLSTLDATMLIVGNMVGVGIFTTTGYIAEYIHSPLFLFLAWMLGGLYAFAGALTYAELATRFPVSGGDYQFLKAAYHPLVGFLFGWSTFTVTYTGSIATIAVGLATYFWNSLIGKPAPSGPSSAVPWLASGFTLLLTWVNCRGIRTGSRLQNGITFLGIGLLFAFVGLGFGSGKGNFSHFLPFNSLHLWQEQLPLLGVALVGILFTYTGWTTVVYIAGEVAHPRRSLPRAMGGGVALVTVLYLLMNAVYLYAFPLPEMKGVVDIGYRTMQRLFGGHTGVFFAGLIMVQILSSLNSTILSGARIYFAMAREGRFFAPAGALNRHNVPANALWLQALWASLLIFSGGFNALLTYTVFVIVMFSFLSGAALFVLRRRTAETETSFRVPGYPVVPLFYLVMSAYVMLNTLIHRPIQSLLGVGIVLSGVPFYLYWNRSQGHET